MDAPYDGTEVTIMSEEMEGYVLPAQGPPKKKKKKYKGAVDQGERAKKPRSAYLLYYYDIYLKVQQDLPNLPQSEINKKISESWRLLSVAEKSYYLEKAKLEKEGQDPNTSDGSSASNQFIVLPVPVRTSMETSSIRLATTYTRRGRGNCTNPSCSYSYVTRHKPPKCPLCDTFLGGKWIPKEKARRKTLLDCKGHPASPGTQSTALVPAQPMPIQKSAAGSNEESAVGSNEESLTAVSQLLSVVPCKNKPQQAEWEEVVISESHILHSDLEDKGSAAQLATATLCSIPLTEKSSPGAGTEPPVESADTTNQVTEVESVGPAISIHSSPPSTTPKGQDLRNKSRARPALLAAARPTRAILPAPVSPSREILSEKLKPKPLFLINDVHSPVRPTGLKPSTLKQLGHSVHSLPKPEDRKVWVVPVNSKSPPPATVLEVKPHVFPSYKYSCTVTLDLGLATSRGRGKCKNPGCSFVYTNRHKPPYCPSCGYDLCKDRMEKVAKPCHLTLPTPEGLNICTLLSQSQKETQRVSTLQLLRKVVQIPENESELADVLALIHELNSSRFILSDMSEETVTIEQTSWSNYYESPATECLLCGSPLFKGEKDSFVGPQECWLLTAIRLQVVTAQAKMCLNPQCLALHSFTDIYTGLFNLGNKLLVSLDLLYTIRNQIKLGEDPTTSVSSVLESVQDQTVKTLSPEEVLQLQELLCNYYWAFECLTIRDYNDMICGVCGIAPKVEIAQRNMKNVLALKDIEFTWPEFVSSGEVNVEDFWFTIEMEVIEQAAFPTGIPITKFDAAIVAPFFAPLMKGAVVVNTEKDKNLDQPSMEGNGSALVRLLRDGSLNLEQIESYEVKELQHLLTVCNIPWELTDTKDTLKNSLMALHTYVQKGSGTRKPPTGFTGGKVYKVCPHQVVCGSKYLVQGESACDHVDLLVSSRYWPPVYMVDIATQVALCADTCYPDLMTLMWGKDQGCFSDPSEPPKHVSAPELLDQHFNVDMTVAEPSLQHPVTKSTCRRVVHAGGEQSSLSDVAAQHRSLSLCRELQPYEAILTAINDSKTSTVRQRPLTFDNATHYYLYNRLIDFLTSREIVNRQIHDIVQSCQPGEVVIRDTLYRLGVAQIKTEDSMDEEEEVEVKEEETEQLLEPV
ncbi:HMG domain-containing protein 3 isoform X2 [Ambystoma mexicanum]|uniref:HMG domain-containing protein 3 isoform X2 n=1 Tax=Ambystoma mexicanum TaxID=8296 RepID=UPI0037E948FD